MNEDLIIMKNAKDLLSDIDIISLRLLATDDVELTAEIAHRSSARVALRNHAQIVSENVNMKNKTFTLIFTLKE